MLVKVHSKHGLSFAGCAAYLLHDEGRADTSHRVSWTQTVRLGTTDPDVAWRVMAATALDQDRLKEESGGSRAGRKAKAGPVLHYTLSWREDEVENLTPEEMRRAAVASMAAIGKDLSKSKRLKSGVRQFGDEHQALIVCHADKAHPHVHVMLNRVHPEHGRYLPDSHDQIKLSRWAEKYETENGKIVCPNRIVNNAARRRGEYVKGQPSLPRPAFESQQQVANDNVKKQQLVAQQQQAAAALAKTQRAVTKRHAAERQAVVDAYKVRAREIIATRRQAIAKGKADVQRKYRPQWEQAYAHLQDSVSQFAEQEKRVGGRLKNAVAAIDFRSLAGRGGGKEDGRAKTIAEAFSLFASSGARMEALRRQHQAKERELLAAQRKEERNAEIKARLEATAAQIANRERLQQERSDLAFKHQGETAKLKTQWREHDRRMQGAWERLAREAPNPKAAKQAQLSPHARATAETLRERRKLDADAEFNSAATKRDAEQLDPLAREVANRLAERRETRNPLEGKSPQEEKDR